LLLEAYTKLHRENVILDRVYLKQKLYILRTLTLKFIRWNGFIIKKCVRIWRWICPCV